MIPAVSAAREHLRERLNSGGAPIRVVGVWDGLSARLAAESGVDALFVSGFAVAASMGLPDADLYAKSDVSRAVGLVSRGTSLPVIADMDSGYGNAITAFHGLRDLERAGAAAVVLEDRVSPRPGPPSGSDSVELVPLDQAAARVRACADARQDPATTIVARTNARHATDVIDRAVAYAEAGADVVFPMRAEAGFAWSEWRTTAEACGRPLAAALVPGSWLEQELTPQRAADAGIAVVIASLQGLLAAATALEAGYRTLAQGDSVSVSATSMAVSQLARHVGMDEVAALQERYLS